MKLTDWKFSDHHQVGKQPGVYVLSLSRSISKLYSDDEKGILYIGKAENLYNRLTLRRKPEWKNRFYKKSELMFDHSTFTYAVDFDDENNLIPHRKLIRSGILKSDDKVSLKFYYAENPKIVESQLLDGHMEMFGQLPLLNNHGSSLKKVWEQECSQLNSSKEYFKQVYESL